MIHSTRAISLVLVSAASVLGGYHALKPTPPDYGDQDEWGDPATRPSGSHYYGSNRYYSPYYHHYYGLGSPGHYGGSAWFGSSYHSTSFGSSGFHSTSFGTTHGGFGSTGHAAHS